MNSVCPSESCTGCKACQDICPHRAITVRVELDRCIPQIRQDACIDCGLCREVCQYHHPLTLHKPLQYLQGWATRESVRSAGTSGGIAGALTQAFLAQGGYVCSCVYREGRFCFALTDSLEEAQAFTGSKYIKSDPEGAWKQIKSLLKQGHQVLLIALPCQVAAAKLYMGSLGEKLYTADLICHGSPSPLLLQRFAQEAGIRLTNPRFRQKQSYCLCDGGTPVAPKGVRDRYTLAFLNGLAFTENCYACPYAREDRVSDLTLGDAWGAEVSKEEAARGVSLVLCQSEKGRELLSMAELTLTDAHRQTALENNHQLRQPYEKPQNRAVFLKALEEGKSFCKSVAAAVPRQCRNQDIKAILAKLGLRS